MERLTLKTDSVNIWFQSPWVWILSDRKRTLHLRGLCDCLPWQHNERGSKSNLSFDMQEIARNHFLPHDNSQRVHRTRLIWGPFLVWGPNRILFFSRFLGVLSELSHVLVLWNPWHLLWNDRVIMKRQADSRAPGLPSLQPALTPAWLGLSLNWILNSKLRLLNWGKSDREGVMSCGFPLCLCC